MELDGSTPGAMANLRRAVVIAATGIALPSALAQDDRSGPEAAEPRPAIAPGIGDPAETGALPPFTSEISKSAAAAMTRGDWEEARQAYLEMLRSDPDNALALANLGAVEYQRGDLEAARAAIEKALGSRPALAHARVTLGLIHYQRGDLMLAVSELTRALHDEPENALAHSYLAVAAKGLGWTNAAELELQRALDLDPGSADAHFNLALMYLERKPPAVELARRHYHRARDLGADPDPLVEEQLESAARK